MGRTEQRHKGSVRSLRSIKIVGKKVDVTEKIPKKQGKQTTENVSSFLLIQEA
jgi:hypothetical protein